MARKFASEDEQKTARKKEMEFPTLHLGWLLRFAVYVRDGMGEPVPLSFRKFMHKNGSHRTMVKAVDAIEELAGKLMIARVILDEDGREGRFTESYSDVSDPKNPIKSKRLGGYVTAHGRAWAEFGEYVGELLDVAVAIEDPAELTRLMEEGRGHLRAYNERTTRRTADSKDRK